MEVPRRKRKPSRPWKDNSLLSSQSERTESRLYRIRARSMHKSGKICCLDAKICWDLDNKVKCVYHEARSTQISGICHKTGVWRTCHQGCQATTSLQGLKTASHWFGSGNINSGIFAINQGVSNSPSLSYTSGSDVLDLMHCLEKTLEFHDSLTRILCCLNCLVCSNVMFRFNLHVRCCYATTSGQQKHPSTKNGGA